MCSHDGCMFNAQNERYYLQLIDEDRFISFLPLNHIAAQYVDTMIPVANRVTMYLARPDALRGTLVATRSRGAAAGGVPGRGGSRAARGAVV